MLSEFPFNSEFYLYPSLSGQEEGKQILLAPFDRWSDEKARGWTPCLKWDPCRIQVLTPDLVCSSSQQHFCTPSSDQGDVHLHFYLQRHFSAFKKIFLLSIISLLFYYLKKYFNYLFIIFFIFYLILIFLAALGVSCGTRASLELWHVGFLFLVVACGFQSMWVL